MTIQNFNKTEIVTKRVEYRFTVNGVDYVYTEHEDERGKVIDTELFTSTGQWVEDEEIEIAIQEFIDQF
jgi:hypothetical protein